MLWENWVLLLLLLTESKKELEVCILWNGKAVVAWSEGYKFYFFV